MTMLRFVLDPNRSANRSVFKGVMLVAQSLDPTVFPQCSRLAANLASAKRLVCGDSDAAANRFIPTTVHVKTQAAKFFFHLQHFELASSLPLELGDQWFQVLAKPPEDIEPPVTVLEAPSHRCMAKVAPGVEPSRPTLDESLL